MTDPSGIAVIGAGWWSQGWHLPHLSRNPDAKIIAIVDTADHPTSSLEPNLESLDALGKRYNCPVFHSTQEMLQHLSDDAIQGAIVCTSHHTHFEVVEELARKKIHILIEKPMTTDVAQAKSLHDLATWSKQANNCGFLVNHSANYRTQSKVSRKIVLESDKIGKLRHVSAYMACPLTALFNNPDNVGWVSPSHGMLGNGFAWGQSCHLIGWIAHVCGEKLVPNKVFCVMDHSKVTGADLSFSASVICEDGVVLSLSGTAFMPGYEHSDPKVSKRISIQIYGDQGALFYGGDDLDPNSGRLEVRLENGEKEFPCACPQELGFHFENTDQDGIGPESLVNFLEACRGNSMHYVGADSLVGFRTVQIVEAMYRSSVAGHVVDILND